MIRPLIIAIGLRYTRAKRRNHFISFISTISMVGIALGVLVLITVLSVMNGFDQQIRTRILSMVPQVTVTEWGQQLRNWQGVAAQLSSNPTITGMAPFVQGEAMITTDGAPAFGVLEGVDPRLESTVSPIASKMVQGSLSLLKPGRFNIVLGQGLAENLGVAVGDKVTVYVPKAQFSPVGILPRLKQLTVVGIFKVGYQYDDSYALMNIQDAQKLLLLPADTVSGLQLKLTDLFLAPQVVDQLNKSLPAGYEVYDWTEQNANFFKALKMEKLMMFLMLVLIIAVAAFNMLSSLVMLVTDKEADIAILRTLGASSRQIMGIFVVQGVVIGLIGIVVGVVAGVLLALHITAITNELQSLLGVQFLNASVYYISFLPSQLEWSDVVKIAVIAFGLSLLATLYPAWRASKIKPAEALRYE